jgi:hypothetical protein
MTSRKTSASLSSFEGVYCSGFFIKNPATVTALSLIFERVHMLNHVEYAIEFSKAFRLEFSGELEEKYRTIGINIAALTDTDDKKKINELIDEGNFHEGDPFSQLEETQRQTALKYLYLAAWFCHSYRDLFPTVLRTDLYPDSKLVDIKYLGPLVEKPYRVRINPMIVSLDNRSDLDSLISNGAIPIIGIERTVPTRGSPSTYPARQVAALLAMKSVEMMLPATCAARGEEILEARERLADHLPPFWASMLRMSAEIRERVENCGSFDQALKECEEIVDTVVRPSLIDLNEKLLKEKRNWFYRILSPVAKQLKVIVGTPPVTTAGLISASLSLGANVAVDVSEHMLKSESLTEAGLTYLLKVGELGSELS